MPESYPPISSYAMISDCHSAALVSLDGSVDWCCFHRFDARPVFARLLDWSRGGYFRIAPSLPHSTSRRYLPGTNILETRYETESGVLLVTDLLPVRETSEASDPDAVFPYGQLLRILRCEAGKVDVAVDLVPRFDYGLTTPEIAVVSPTLVTFCGGADALIVQSELPLAAATSSTCSGSWTLEQDQETFVVVTHSLPHRLRARTLAKSETALRLEFTKRFWTDWSARLKYEGRYREQVLRSALVLKGLTNSETGAIAAAPTTSLPEAIGGVRNWDYRYTWLRDASFTLDALFGVGYIEEAVAFMRWLRRTIPVEAGDLQIVYGIGGERLLPEVELTEVEGYRGSRPVRVGNAASGQFQLDIYGELINTAWLFLNHGGVIDFGLWDFLRRVAAHVEEHWTQPDEGIWEVRGGRRHFTHSKVMAWVAMDRVIKLAKRMAVDSDRLEHWTEVRDRIRQRIETEGIDKSTGAFVQSFGSTDVDASSLVFPLVGFLPARDIRVEATRERVERELSSGIGTGLLYRYRNRQDSFESMEGTFAICSFWLVENLVYAGQVARGRELFEHLLGYLNDVGLMAEQIDAGSGEQLGNFPQAFSHVGLINAALLLSRKDRIRD